MMMGVCTPPTRSTASTSPLRSARTAASPPTGTSVELLRSTALNASRGSTKARVPLPVAPTAMRFSRNSVSCVSGLGIAIEDPQRLVVEARQHLDVIGIECRRDAALHERDVHAGLGVPQQAQVVGGAPGHSFLDDDPVRRQDLLVALRELMVDAELRARRHDDPARGRRLQELRREPQRHADQHDDQHGHSQLVAAGKRRQVVVVSHRGHRFVRGRPRETRIGDRRMPVRMADRRRHEFYKESTARNAAGCRARPVRRAWSRRRGPAGGQRSCLCRPATGGPASGLPLRAVRHPAQAAGPAGIPYPRAIRRR